MKPGKDILSIVLVLGCFFGVARIMHDLHGRQQQVDFSHYYVTSRLLLDGINPYTVSLGQYYEQYGMSLDKHNHFATFAPTLGWLFAPFAKLSPEEAFVAWQLVQFACLIFIFLQIRGLLGKHIVAGAYMALCAVTMLSNPVYAHFYSAQIQFLLLALILLAYGLNRNRRYYQAVLIITLAGAIKIFPLALVPWFVLRVEGNWRVRLALVLEVLVVLGLVIVFTDAELWLDFLSHGLVEIDRFVINRVSNYSLPSFVVNLAYILSGSPNLDQFSAFWVFLGKVTGMLLILCAYALVLARDLPRHVEFSILLIAILLGGIICWLHYLVFLVFPIAVALTSSRLMERPKEKFFFYMLILVFFSANPSLAPRDNHLARILVAYIPTYALVVFPFLLIKLQDVPDANPGLRQLSITRMTTDLSDTPDDIAAVVEYEK